MSIKRKNISFIEDIVEEAFGEVTPKNMEITKLLFDYMLKEIEYNSETIAFHYKYLGLFYQDLKLLKTKLHRVNEEKDYEKHRQIRDRISLIEIISDEKGKVRNKQLSYPLMLERYLRKKFEIINTNASGNGRIPPLHFVAIEKVQNKNFKLHAQNNF